MAFQATIELDVERGGVLDLGEVLVLGEALVQVVEFYLGRAAQGDDFEGLVRELLLQGLHEHVGGLGPGRGLVGDFTCEVTAPLGA